MKVADGEVDAFCHLGRRDLRAQQMDELGHGIQRLVAQRLVAAEARADQQGLIKKRIKVAVKGGPELAGKHLSQHENEIAAQLNVVARGRLQQPDHMLDNLRV
jgi:hypothetical protein